MRNLAKPIGVSAFVVVAINGLFLWYFPEERERLTSTISKMSANESERGFLYKTYVDASGKKHPYCVFVPYGMTDSDRLPLILYLNGYGKNGSDGLAPLLDGLAPAIWETKRFFPFVVAFPQCPNGDAWTAGGEATQLAMTIMERTAQEYHTDPDRVILTGISSGGAGTWSIAARHPDRFAAIVPISSHGVSGDDAQVVVDAGLPVWNFYVGEDDPGLVAGNRKSYRKLLELGANVRSTEVRTSPDVVGLNKHDAWSFAYRDAALIDWMWGQHRSTNDSEDQTFQIVRFDESLLPKEREADGVTWSASSDGYELQTRLHRPGRLFLPTSVLLDGSGEVHVEFRPGAGTGRCGIGSVSPSSESVQEGDFLLELAIDDPNCGGHYDAATGRCLTPADPISERALLFNEWNDLRIRWLDGKVHAELNGWPLFESPAMVEFSGDGHLTFSFSGDEGAIIDWRYLRSKGTWFSDVVPEPHFETVRRNGVHRVKIQEIVSAWSERADATPEFRLTFEQQRQGIHRWGRFRSAVAPKAEFDTSVMNNIQYSHVGHIVVSTPWWYPNTRISRQHGLVGEIFENDFFQLLAQKFPDPVEQRCNPSVYRSIRTPDSRLDSVSDEEDDLRGIVLSPSGPSRPTQLEEWYIQCILTALRPLDALGGVIDIEHCRLMPEASIVDGQECLVVEENLGDEHTDSKRRFYVDPKQQFAVLRVAELHDEQLTRQVDVSYTTQSSGEVRPEMWKVVSVPPAATSTTTRFYPGNERVIESAVAELADWQHGTIETPGNSAERQFPVGTAYFDQRDGQWYVAAENGPLPMGSELVSVYATGARLPLRSSRLYGIIVGAIGLALLVMLIVRRRLRSQSIANLEETDKPLAV